MGKINRLATGKALKRESVTPPIRTEKRPAPFGQPEGNRGAKIPRTLYAQDVSGAQSDQQQSSQSDQGLQQSPPPPPPANGNQPQQQLDLLDSDSEATTSSVESNAPRVDSDSHDAKTEAKIARRQKALDMRRVLSRKLFYRPGGKALCPESLSYDYSNPASWSNPTLPELRLFWMTFGVSHHVVNATPVSFMQLFRLFYSSKCALLISRSPAIIDPNVCNVWYAYYQRINQEYESSLRSARELSVLMRQPTFAGRLYLFAKKLEMQDAMIRVFKPVPWFTKQICSPRRAARPTASKKMISAHNREPLFLGGGFSRDHVVTPAGAKLAANRHDTRISVMLTNCKRDTLFRINDFDGEVVEEEFVRDAYALHGVPFDSSVLGNHNTVDYLLQSLGGD